MPLMTPQVNRVRKSIGLADHAVMIGGALALAWTFTSLLIAYYRSIHAGGGAAFAAYHLGRPVAFVCALLGGYAGWWASRSRPRRLLWAVVAMVATIGLLFAAEWIRTSDDRARDRLAWLHASPNDGLKLASVRSEGAASLRSLALWYHSLAA